MARKDEILKSFLSHELLSSRYGLEKDELPKTVREAMTSEIPIVKAIAFIVEGLHTSPQPTETALRSQILQLLNNGL
jgi:hypothetical protein